MSSVLCLLARTECLNRSPHDQFRTPGQILSLRLPFVSESESKEITEII